MPCRGPYRSNRVWLQFTHRPRSNSFLGLPYRILNIIHRKELLKGPWVVYIDTGTLPECFESLFRFLGLSGSPEFLRVLFVGSGRCVLDKEVPSKNPYKLAEQLSQRVVRKLLRNLKAKEQAGDTLQDWP